MPEETTNSFLLRNDATAPAVGGEAVDISSTDHTPTKYGRAVYVGDVSGGATLKVTTVDGSTLSFAGLVVGSVIPVSTKLIWKTGTAATSLIVLW